MITVQFATLEDFLAELDPREVNQPIRVASAEGPPNPSGGPPIWVVRAGVPVNTGGQVFLYEATIIAAGESSAQKEEEALQAALEQKELDVHVGSRYEVA